MAIVEFAMLAAMCAPNVHLTTLESVVTHESRANIYAIGVNGGTKLQRQPANLDEAVATAEWLKANGYDFDGGLGQVNVRNLPGLGMTIPDLFDPCKNLAGAAKVLTDCYDRAVPQFGAGQPALRAALSCYNTGNFERGFKNGYVQKVAAQVGVSVPALEPITDKDGQKPVELKATKGGGSATKTVSSSAPKAKAKSDGLGDVFSGSGGDAFSSSDETVMVQ